eukprot:3250045-Prymnesium_polylepis.1
MAPKDLKVRGGHCCAAHEPSKITLWLCCAFCDRWKVVISRSGGATRTHHVVAGTATHLATSSISKRAAQ